MKVDGRHFRSIWLDPDGWSVGAIDQRRLPHEFVVARLTDCAEAAEAIRSMLVRGAPLIGATAAYGMALVKRATAGDDNALRELMVFDGQLTDANAALFDVANNFHGCIAGINEILARQGLLAGRWCLDPHEDLSPGQAAEIDRVCAAYPHLTDDAFVAQHRDRWLS